MRCHPTAQARLHARDDGKVSIEIREDDTRLAEFELCADEAARLGQGLIQKAQIAREMVERTRETPNPPQGGTDEHG